MVAVVIFMMVEVKSVQDTASRFILLSPDVNEFADSFNFSRASLFSVAPFNLLRRALGLFSALHLNIVLTEESSNFLHAANESVHVFL